MRVIGKKQLLFTFLAIFSLLVAIVKNVSYASGLSEDRLRAALLYNFAQYVDGFDDSRSRFTICLFIDGIIGKNYTWLKSEKIKGKPVKVVNGESLNNFTVCQLVFSTYTSQRQQTRLLKRFRNRPVLTVGVEPDFTAKGGIIYLYKRKNKIRFVVNLRNAKSAGLKVSSRLISVAKIED